MSQRETIAAPSLQQWKGINQRLQPTLVPDGFFADARGIFFGYGENAERLPGKTLAGQMPTAVLGIFSFNRKVLIQTLDALWITNVDELTSLDLLFQPGIPDAPVLSNVLFTSMDVTMPATLPIYTDDFSLQRSLDEITWTTIATGLATLQVYPDTGLSDDTTYYYRVLAVNSDAYTAGPSANATTPLIPPTFLRVTEAGDQRITEAGDDRITEF